MSRQKELIPMLPGELLRFEREQAGLSLERAAAMARIKPSILAAIESGETGDMPSVYLRGYLRNYARALGIDPADIEEQIHQTQGADPRVQSIFIGKSNRSRAEKWLKASSYLAASAVIAALVWQFTHEAVRFSQGDPQLSSAAVAPSGQADSSRDVSQQASRTANTHLSASIASMEVMQRGSGAGNQSVAEEAWSALSDAAATPQTDPGTQALTVRTSADSWVEILDGEGAQLELDLIRAGNERTYNGTGPFEVMFGRASAVELTLDGQPVDLAPFTQDNVARLTLGDSRAAEEQPAAEAGNR